MYYYLFYTVSTPSDKNGEEERISDRMLNFGELSSDQAAVKKLKTFQEEETDFCGRSGRKFVFGTLIGVKHGKVTEVKIN